MIYAELVANEIKKELNELLIKIITDNKAKIKNKEENKGLKDLYKYNIKEEYREE